MSIELPSELNDVKFKIKKKSVYLLGRLIRKESFKMPVWFYDLSKEYGKDMRNNNGKDNSK